MTNRKETKFGGNRKEQLYHFCQAKGKHSWLVPQELREVLYPHEGLAFFFIQVESEKLTSGGSATCFGIPEVISL